MSVMKRCGIYFFVLIALFVTVSPAHAMLRRSGLRMWHGGSPFSGVAINAALHNQYQQDARLRARGRVAPLTSFANNQQVGFLFPSKIDQQYADALKKLYPHPYFAPTEQRCIDRTDKKTELFAVRNIEKGELLGCVVGVPKNWFMSVLGVSEDEVMSDHVPVSSGFGPCNVIFEQWVTECGDVLTVCVADSFIAQGEQVKWGVDLEFWDSGTILIAILLSFNVVLLLMPNDVLKTA